MCSVYMIKAILLLNYDRLSFPMPGAPRQVDCCEEAGGGDEAESEPTAAGGVQQYPMQAHHL